MRAARIQARRSGLAAGVGMILGGAGFVADSAYAEAFSPQNLAAILVSTAFPGGGGAVEVAEYTKGGVQVGSLVQLPVTEPLGFSMSDIQNHDRHLHRSTDGRYLTFTGYGYAAGATDPATLSSTVVAAELFDTSDCAVHKHDSAKVSLAEFFIASVLLHY